MRAIVVTALLLAACRKPVAVQRPVAKASRPVVGAPAQRMLPAVRVRGDLPPGASPTPTGGERDVVAVVCIDGSGRVSDVRVIMAPAGRHTEVTNALGRWQFKPYEARGERRETCVSVAFALGDER